MESIDTLIEQLGSSDQATAYKAKRALELAASAAAAPGNDQDRKQLAAALAKALDAKNDKNEPKYSAAVRQAVCRILGSIGGDEEVAALRGQSDNFEARESARFALDRIPTAAATTALAESAQQAVGNEFRVGAINALGRRSGSDVVAALRQCVADNDREVRLAAAEALANQADAGSDELLAKLIADEAAADNARAVKRLNIARLQLAATLAAAGQQDAARTICRGAASSACDDIQKQAAERELAKLG